MSAERYLIVNADDFGQSTGINRGVIAAHENGIVTSASLMVRWPAAPEAAEYAQKHPDLSLGLHLDLGEWVYRGDAWSPVYNVVPLENTAAVEEEVHRQIEVFRRLAGHDPTHIDSHQHVHQDEPLLSTVSGIAGKLGVNLRGVSGIRYCGDFYGQTATGEPYHDAITLAALLVILEGLPAGITELGCHPGSGTDLDTMYVHERKSELAVLCDPRVRQAISSERIFLCSFGEVNAMNSAAGSAQIRNFRTFSISRGLNADTTSTDAAILRSVGRDKRVLELGCGCGHMSQALREQGCTVVGVEIHPEASQAASNICERVIIGDLDYLNFDRELGDDRFDTVLAADVLEHLKDPLSVLQAVKRFLLPDGDVVISVPNVAHISIRLALLAGKFPYSERGLLDQTHLRFFTRESLEKLMEDADLVTGHFERITIAPVEPSQFEVPYDPAIVPPALLEQLSRDPEALTYQFVISGFPLSQSSPVLIRNCIKHLAHEVDTARKTISTLQGKVQSMWQETESLKTEIAQLRDAGNQSAGAPGSMQEGIQDT
jgi:predicted glycoside hydrolase/deacetylase ChbG (UPF0249 family)/2-polyprenyl-3-methyl-5-hydroxy-6-metoxy-1,4-benzoquinol methylase